MAEPESKRQKTSEAEEAEAEAEIAAMIEASRAAPKDDSIPGLLGSSTAPLFFQVRPGVPKGRTASPLVAASMRAQA